MKGWITYYLILGYVVNYGYILYTYPIISNKAMSTSGLSHFYSS